MAALMLFLRGVGMLVGGALIWIIFALVPPWLCGFALCRHNAWWTSADKVRGFVTIKSERLRRLLIPEYIGWNSVIRTDIPIFFNRYTMNKYPERLSALGLLNYIVTILTSLTRTGRFGRSSPSWARRFCSSRWRTGTAPSGATPPL